MPYTARDFFDPFKDVFRACIMLPIERVEKGWSCQVIYCFNNQWDERVGFMQSLAWISNLSESNKLPLENSRLFFHFWKCFDALILFIQSHEKREWKTFSEFSYTMRFESWFDCENFCLCFHPLDSPRELPLHIPYDILPSSFHWIMCEHGDTNEPQHETIFLPTARNELNFCWCDKTFCVCARCNVALFYINICLKHLKGISFFNWLSYKQQQRLKVYFFKVMIYETTIVSPLSVSLCWYFLA